MSSPATPPGDSGAQAAESAFAYSGLKLPAPYRQVMWQTRALALVALVGCVCLFLFVRLLAASPILPISWQADASGIVLSDSPVPELRPMLGRTVIALSQPGPGPAIDIKALPDRLASSARWVLRNDERAATLESQALLSRLVQEPHVRLHFADGSQVDITPRPRGMAWMGVMFWALTALALLLFLVGIAVLLARMRARNALYSVMALTQSANLMLMAVQYAGGLGLPPGFTQWDLVLRTLADLITGAAALHAALLPPLRKGSSLVPVIITWALTALVGVLLVNGGFGNAWMLTQGFCLLLAAVLVATLTLSHRREPNPLALMLRRYAVATLVTLCLLMLAIVAGSRQPDAQREIAQAGSVLWYVFLASMLLLMPFMSRSQQLMREFALLAGVSTVATSLDLLFVATFSLNNFTSLSLAVFIALGLYAGSRQWVLSHMVGSRPLTAEGMFERLYRVVREAEAKPQQVAPLLTRLLRDMYDPLEVTAVARQGNSPRVVADGTAMVVPLPFARNVEGNDEADALMLRYAGRGRRLFTPEDARLTAQVMEQVVRAVVFDQAMERGRAEERLRIAQDLHDDIGARLLTLMYQAQTHEMEDYIRHTLQDLKTLTRGLAATDHRLSHAVAEWKADIAQRLSAAHIELDWSFKFDEDLNLGMVQWSALTRILRELVTNAIYHASATRLTIDAQLERKELVVTVADNGLGSQPQAWAHGLGLGGVRKRVKVLNGEVTWRENRPNGIVCEVRIARFTGGT